MIVRELITSLGFRLNQGQISRAEQNIHRLKTQADAASAAFRNMALAFVGIASIKAFINVGDQMQSLEARIGMLPQTVGDVGKAFDTVADRAINARSSLQAYGTLYTRIGHASKDYVSKQEDVLNITSTISKALVVGGATAQEASSTMIQFAQALGSGTLQGEEFRAMAEAAPQYMDKLAETLGHPRSALKKLASEGKITSKDVIEATLKMKDYFDGQMMKIPMTVGQATTIIAARWGRMIQRMNRESSFISNIAETLINGFDSIERGLSRTVEAFGGFSNMMRFIGVTIGVALGAKTIQIVRAFGLAFLRASIPIIAITAAILLTSLAVDDLITYINGGNSVIGEFIQYLNSGTVASTLLKLAIMGVGAAVSAFALIHGAAFLATMSKMLWTFGALGTAALVNGARMAAGWLLALGPIGWTIAGLTAIVALMAKISGNKNIEGVGEYDAMGNYTGVSPESMAPSAMGQGGTSVKNETNVTVTVPPGTTAEQAKFLQDAAQKSFGMSSEKYARDLGVYAP